jgi:hypothetical protein
MTANAAFAAASRLKWRPSFVGKQAVGRRAVAGQRRGMKLSGWRFALLSKLFEGDDSLRLSVPEQALQ